MQDIKEEKKQMEESRQGEATVIEMCKLRINMFTLKVTVVR